MPGDVTVPSAGATAQRFRASQDVTEFYLPTWLESSRGCHAMATGRTATIVSDVG
jgi:hypothetical protein